MLPIKQLKNKYLECVPMEEADLDAVLAIEKQSFQTPWSKISFSGEVSNTYSYNYVVIPISACPLVQVSNLSSLVQVSDLSSLIQVSDLSSLVQVSDLSSLVQVSDLNQQKITVIAYMCFHLITDEAEILKIAVAPEWRRCGIGAWLLERCLRLAQDKGAITVFLEVSSSNHTAIILYHKLGFQVIGKRMGYYSEINEDALVMMKKLNGS